jgi:hypothetical protein
MGGEVARVVMYAFHPSRTEHAKDEALGMCLYARQTCRNTVKLGGLMASGLTNIAHFKK